MTIYTRIKICGLTCEQDVDAAVAAGADAIGFVLYPKSVRYVTPMRAAVLAKRLPPFVTPVLLFVNEKTSEIIASCAMVPGAIAQFHGDETPEACLEASTSANCNYLRAARIPLGAEASRFDLIQFAQDFSGAQGILLDAHVAGYGGAGQTFDWSCLPPWVDAHLVLGGGLTSTNVSAAIQQVRPRCRSLAVDVSSGVEVAKGIKDAEKMRQFIAAVRAVDGAAIASHQREEACS